MELHGRPNYPLFLHIECMHRDKEVGKTSLDSNPALKEEKTTTREQLYLEVKTSVLCRMSNFKCNAIYNDFKTKETK